MPTRSPDIEIRPAAPGELSAAARVYVLAEGDSLARRREQAERTGDAVEAAAVADLRVAVAEGPEQVLVAVAAGSGEVVGVAAWRVWERWWFLSYLFVLPA